MPDYHNLPVAELEDAEHMDEIEGHDGTRYRVLVSKLDGSKQVVHADVVEYDSLLEHPYVRGVGAGFALIGALLTPLLAAALALDTGYLSSGFFAGAASMAAGFMLFMNLLNRGGAGASIDRMLEWNRHKELAMRKDSGGMS
jgi:hypothetical protein